MGGCLRAARSRCTLYREANSYGRRGVEVKMTSRLLHILYQISPTRQVTWSNCCTSLWTVNLHVFSPMPPWTFSSPDPDFPIWSCHQAGGFCDWCGGGNACCKPLGDQFHSPACWDGHKEGDSTLGWENPPFFWNHTWEKYYHYCML